MPNLRIIHTNAEKLHNKQNYEKLYPKEIRGSIVVYENPNINEERKYQLVSPDGKRSHFINLSMFDFLIHSCYIEHIVEKICEHCGGIVYDRY